MRKNFLLLTVSFFLSLLAAEMLLRWHPPVMAYINTRNIVQQTHSQPSPNSTLFYVPRANLSKPFSNREFRTLVTINSQSMRDREYGLKKPAGVKRIAMLGDSFVFGWGVENKEIFTEILEDRYLKNVEALNFGVSGYDARQEVERLKEEGLKFGPDVAFLFLYGFPEDAPQSFEFRNGNLYWQVTEKKTLWRDFKIFIKRNVYLFWLYENFRGHGGGEEKKNVPAPDFFPEEIVRGLKVLSDFKALAAENGFHPVIVYIPNKWHLLDPQALQSDLRGIRRIEEFSRNAGISFFDLTPHLTKEWKETGQMPYFRFDDHWNRSGHEAAAKLIADFLKREKILTGDYFR